MRPAAALMAAVLTVAGFAYGEDRRTGRVALPAVKIENGKSCVAPVEEMRRNHMSMLFHQRDRALRQGLREPRFSLKGCVECHASQKTASVLGKEGFCSSCHEYAAVKIDCFECHTPLRQEKAARKP